MAKKVRHLRFAFGLVLAAVTIEPGFSSESFNIYLRNPGMTTRNLGHLSAAKLYSLSLSVPSPLTLRTSVVRVTIKDPHTLIAAKTLHVGDPDLYLFFRPITDGDVYLAADWNGPARAPLEIDVLCIPWSPKPGDAGRLEAEPNNTWRQANPIELGKTIFATADDAPYIAVGEEREIEVLNRAVDWYRLEIQDPRPLLVFFEIDILDRDNIPVDVSVYRLENGNIVAHEEGMDPVSAPHEVQALPGNKFTTRLLRQGTYFVRVAASHPVPLRTLQNAVQKASSAQVPENLLAISLEIAFTQTALSKNPQVADLLDQFIARRDTSRWTLLLELAERNRAVLGSLQMLSLVSDAVVSPDESLARRARDLVRKNPSLARNPGIAAALAESVEGEAALSRPSDKATYAIPGPKGNASPATVPLDYGFFVQRVMPVLGAKGPDGAACVYCHATHTIFRLNPPPKQGDYSEAQLRENYRSALKVVDPDNPENSLILRKPLSTAEVEGTLGTGTLAHGGGQRWNGADHPAYKTILDWIRGAKLTSNREP